jgi:uncharacterized damage-inducible protein DinB
MIDYSGKDLARAFRTVRQNTIQIATDIPEEQYGFRPTADSRSVAEILAHVAAQTGWIHRLHGVDRKTFVTLEDFGGYLKDAGAFEQSLTTQPAIFDALTRQGAAFSSWLEGLSEAALGEFVGFPSPIDPPKKTRFEMLLGAKEHEMHHRAQLMVIERLLGIVPHLTRARQARMAPAPPPSETRA